MGFRHFFSSSCNYLEDTGRTGDISFQVSSQQNAVLKTKPCPWKTLGNQIILTNCAKVKFSNKRKHNCCILTEFSIVMPTYGKGVRGVQCNSSTIFRQPSLLPPCWESTFASKIFPPFLASKKDEKWSRVAERRKPPLVPANSKERVKRENPSHHTWARSNFEGGGPDFCSREGGIKSSPERGMKSFLQERGIG